MSAKKVPVVVYKHGERVIVGEAEVQVNLGFVTVSARIDPEYADHLYNEVKHVSMGPINVGERF